MQQVVWLDALALFGERSLEGVARLDANVLRAQVVLPGLYIFIDYHCRLSKALLYICAGLRARLEEYQIVLVCECLPFFSRHLSLKFQVTFVADQEDDHF